MSFVKLDHKLKDWQWITEPNMVALWIRLLLEANYAENNWKGVVLPRGTFATSVKSLSEKTGLSIQQTRNNLKKLQTTNEIAIKSTNKYSIITITKWEEYQGGTEKPTNKPTNKPSQNQQTKVNKTNNTIRNIEDKKKRNIFIPPTLDDVIAYCEERKNGVDAKKFYEYYSIADWKDSQGRQVKNWKQKLISQWEKGKPKEEDKPSSERYKIPWLN